MKAVPVLLMKELLRTVLSFADSGAMGATRLKPVFMHGEPTVGNQVLPSELPPADRALERAWF